MACAQTGATIEFAGEAIASLTMEARMSICNMAIEAGGLCKHSPALPRDSSSEQRQPNCSCWICAGPALMLPLLTNLLFVMAGAGARAGLIQPDEITFEYLRGRPMVPKEDSQEWAKAKAYWTSLASDPGAHYDTEVIIEAADIAPTVTWGTSPQDTAPITGVVPDPSACADPARRAGMERALAYMGLSDRIGDKLTDVKVDKVFVGSCTNGRIEDIRAVASVAKGRKVAPGVEALVVPGSGLVKQQAEEEGLADILIEAGFDWRQPGCSMCLAMNADKLGAGERCASTSNRNFEGRQGNGGRTHLVSPAMAAAAAVNGTLSDIRDLELSVLPPSPVSASGAKGSVYSTMYAEAVDSAGPVIREQAASSAASDEAPAAGMPAFTVLKGRAAPLDIQNVDTDMIIPKEYLKTIKRTGLGFAAFAELRYKNPVEVAQQGPSVAELIDDFVLNRPEYEGASILVAGDNFGCGSSREHAPWSINGMGIRCIISTSFADIFFNNCFKNGM
eukprot:SAG31_NODE_5570_length_2452_cov_1.442839_3_plen_504_part_01